MFWSGGIALIRPIEIDFEAINFLNAVPYPETVPHNFPINSKCSLVLGVYSPALVGAFPLQKFKNYIEIHAAFLPRYRGAFAVNSAKQAFEWIWANTNYKRIIADISDPKIEPFAQRCGMVKTGKYYEVYHGQFCK